MKGDSWVITNEFQRKQLIEAINEKDFGEFGFNVQIKTGQRTLAQNNSMHQFFSLLANELTDAGLDMRTTLKADTELPWDAQMVKRFIWLPVMKALTNKTSTAKLDRKEVSEIYEVIARHMAQTHSIMCPFPSNEPPL